MAGIKYTPHQPGDRIGQYAVLAELEPTRDKRGLLIRRVQVRDLKGKITVQPLGRLRYKEGVTGKRPETKFEDISQRPQAHTCASCIHYQRAAATTEDLDSDIGAVYCHPRQTLVNRYTWQCATMQKLKKEKGE